MIITRTPFRVSFAGGGSDLPDYYLRADYGAVVSTAVQAYMYIAIHPYFQDKIRIKYSLTEDVEHIDDIRHPIVRECLRKVHIEKGIEIASFADVPAGTGLGSSSAFTVGLLNALYAFQGRMVSRDRLAAEACEIEIDILGEPIGKQDQYAAAYGGLNRIQFNPDQTVHVTPILLDAETRAGLEARLRLYHVGGSRPAGGILAEQKGNTRRPEKMEYLKRLVELADALSKTLKARDLGTLGQVLHRGWELKKNLAGGITNGAVNGLYDRLRALGAAGGKLLGAGGTGFMLMFAEDHDGLQKGSGCKTLPVRIDREGTKIIFFEK